VGLRLFEVLLVHLLLTVSVIAVRLQTANPNYLLLWFLLLYQLSVGCGRLSVSLLHLQSELLLVIEGLPARSGNVGEWVFAVLVGVVVTRLEMRLILL
jgi:hypothetical protein